MNGRRSFLRGLAALPMIGGSVALIGAPTAAAVPVTDDLLRAYDIWLDLERSWLLRQQHGVDAFSVDRGAYCEVVWRDKASGECWSSHRVPRGGERFDHSNPASRAAIVLSAAGCPLT